MLIIVSGLPGTGKTAVADAVARACGGVHLSIDTAEDALLGAGLPPSFETGVGAYEAVRAAAEQNLALGHTVVVDAVNDSEPARDTWRQASAHTGAPLLFALLELRDATEHRRRLEGRVRPLRHVLEPTWAQVQHRAGTFEPWVGDHLRLDAAEPVEQLAAAILAAIPGRDRHHS